MARSYPEAQNAALNPSMGNGSINTPPVQDFDTPAMQGSMQQFLADNLGTYVVIEFLIGTQAVTRKSGVLYAVGTSVVTLYEEISQTFVTCDIFSIKFVTFYLPGRRPWQVQFPAAGQVGMPPMGQMGSQTPVQWNMGLGQTGMAAPGFAPSMDTSEAPGCISGNCGGGATTSWG